MSSPKWHRDLPYREGMRAWRLMRRTLFTAPRSEGEYVVAAKEDTDLLELKHEFGKRNFGPGHRFSYDKGEDLNLRRVFFDPYRFDDVDWWQTHVRVWDDDKLWIRGHVEAKPEDHPKPHLDEVGLTVDTALSEIERILAQTGNTYQRRQWTDGN